MKKLCSLIILFIFSGYLYAQKVSPAGDSKINIQGVWQRDSKIIGSGMGQNFKFLKNDSFVLSLEDGREDARMLLGINGRYRLVGNQLYFTIVSRTVIDGNIVLTEPAVDLNLFSIENGKVSVIREKEIKELPQSADILFLSPTNMKINNEEYYKVKDQ